MRHVSQSWQRMIRLLWVLSLFGAGVVQGNGHALLQVICAGWYLVSFLWIIGSNIFLFVLYLRYHNELPPALQ